MTRLSSEEKMRLREGQMAEARREFFGRNRIDVLHVGPDELKMLSMVFEAGWWLALSTEYQWRNDG